MECINLHKKKFKARVGSPFKNEKAQEIGEEIERITTKSGGEFVIKDVLKEAKRKNNPLHNHLEWNDTKAGEKFRIQQLKNITAHIVEEIIVDGEPSIQRSFLESNKIPVENNVGERVYVSRETAIENVDYKKQLLNKMITTMENITITMKLFRDYD